jgi:hypothetical protein
LAIGFNKEFKPLVLLKLDLLSQRLYIWLSTGSVLRLLFKSLHPKTWSRLHADNWRRWSRTIFPRHMGDNLVLGLITISVSGLFSSDVRLYAISVSQRGGMCVQELYLDVIVLNINKFFPFQNKLQSK